MSKTNRPDREALFKEMMSYLAEKYDLSETDMERILQKEVPEHVVPMSIFRTGKLSPLEAIVKHLRENEGMKLSEIARLVGRDPRAIGVTYTRAKKKMPETLAAPVSEYSFPIMRLQDKTLSVFEHLAKHLREKYSLRFNLIAKVMNRDERTIWTVCKRYNDKIRGEIQ